MMKPASLLLVILVVLGGAAGTAKAWPPWKEHMSVNILNELATPPLLSLHCKSQDDDLGQHTVMPHQKYGFGFYPNVIGTTLFWCNFQWGSKSQGFTVWHDIGSWGKQKKLCNQCVYKLQNDGFYRSEGPSGPFSKVYDWK